MRTSRRKVKSDSVNEGGQLHEREKAEGDRELGRVAE
jgi:hypothetical protein